MTSQARVDPGPPRRPRAAASVASTGVALAVALWSQVGPFLEQPGASWRTFREFFSYDQLSYLAIVANGRHGNFAAVEPFTESGTNHYPRGYYLLLGLLAQVTDDVTLAWNVGAVVALAVLVAATSVTTILLTRRAWTGALAAAPLLVGTFAGLTGDGWYTNLESHAVLWGAFAVMFAANGESVALSVAGVSLLALVLVAAGRITGRRAGVVAVAACAVVGLLANVHTYTFLTAAYLMLGAGAAVGLARRPRPVALAATGVLAVAVVVVGPVLAAGVGPLAALAFGAAPAVPGLRELAVQTRWRALWCVGALAAFAAPQMIGTVLGVAAGDAFLLYRQASSNSLGVPLGPGVLAAAVPVLGLVVVGAVGVRRRQPVAVGIAAGTVAVWVLLAANDRWGANQEPYRFWIDAFMLACVVLVPVLGWLAAEGGAPMTRSHPGRAVRPAPVSVALVLLAGVAAVSTIDYATFRRDVRGSAAIQVTTARSLAMAEAARGAGRDLVLPDPCIDPPILKAVWGGRVGSFNAGLAWPENKDALQAALEARAEGRLDVDAAARAGVGWVLVDSACPAGWGDVAGAVDPAAVAEYPGGRIALVELGA